MGCPASWFPSQQQATEHPPVLFVAGAVEMFLETLRDECFITLLTDVLGALDMPIACCSDAELGIPVEQPTIPDRAIPIGRFAWLTGIAAQQFVGFVQPTEIASFPGHVPVVDLCAGVNHLPAASKHCIRGWCLGEIFERSSGSILFPRTDLDIIAAFCHANFEEVKAGRPAKPIALVGWDPDIWGGIATALFHGIGNKPDWLRQFQLDRDGTAARIARFLTKEQLIVA